MHDPLPTVRIFCPHCGDENLITGMVLDRPIAIVCVGCGEPIVPPRKPAIMGAEEFNAGEE